MLLLTIVLKLVPWLLEYINRLLLLAKSEMKACIKLMVTGDINDRLKKDLLIYPVIV